MGFDATTQDGVHINSVHVTTETTCCVVAIDTLPGGTAEDYCKHVTGSFDNLASIYSSCKGENEDQVKGNLIKNVTHTMADRCTANHAHIRSLEKMGQGAERAELPPPIHWTTYLQYTGRHGYQGQDSTEAV